MEFLPKTNPITFGKYTLASLTPKIPKTDQQKQFIQQDIVNGRGIDIAERVFITCFKVDRGDPNKTKHKITPAFPTRSFANSFRQDKTTKIVPMIIADPNWKCAVTFPGKLLAPGGT